jgi:hypothetical protein
MGAEVDRLPDLSTRKKLEDSIMHLCRAYDNVSEEDFKKAMFQLIRRQNPQSSSVVLGLKTFAQRFDPDQKRFGNPPKDWNPESCNDFIDVVLARLWRVYKDVNPYHTCD